MKTFEVGENMKQIEVSEVPAPGFGNQDSTISHKKSFEHGSLTAEMESRMYELISSGECMVLAQEEDDGCIDGRSSEQVTFVNDAGELTTNPVTLEDGNLHVRQKLAGGGYITALAMKRGVEPAQSTIEQDLTDTVADLSQQSIHCGIHTGEHGSEENCDCGANHLIKQIMENGVLYGKEVSGQVEGLLSFAGLPFEQSVMNGVLSGWASTVNQPSYFEGSTSMSRVSVILKQLHVAQKNSGASRPFAVSKHLKGSHKEVAKVINYVDGYSFSQNLYLLKMSESFPEVPLNELPQIFAVDVPRIAQIAKAKAANYAQDERDKKEQAFLYAGIAYQSATEATLTDGTMRTFLIAA